MEIVEYFTHSKTKNIESNEDGIFIGNDFIAIIDGVTSKGTKLWNNCSSGQFAKDFIISVLKNIEISEFNAKSFFEFLDLKLGLLIRNNLLVDFPRASVLIYSDFHSEIWSYGDCQFMIDNKLYKNNKKIDIINSELRSFFIERELICGQTIETFKEYDYSRDFILENIKSQFFFENIENQFGYPIINGGGILESFIIKKFVSKGSQVVIGTDGYPKLFNTLELSEQYLMQILENDPLCFRLFKSTKGIQKGSVSFDDRTYCRIIT